MNGVEVKNTVKFSFGDGARKPSMGEIINFAKTLDADPMQMEAIYRVAEEKSLFIKFKVEEAMCHTLKNNSEQLTFRYDDGKAVEVHMLNADEYIQYVRVYDLPPEVPDKNLALVLGKYGKVKRVVREKFPPELGFDIYTGIRGVYMDVKKEIPTSLHFLNRKGNVFYPGNKNVCFVCKIEGHQMNSCPKRKPRRKLEKQQTTDTEKRDPDEAQSVSSVDTCTSYAGVLAGDASADAIEVFDEEVMAIDETTPDMEEEQEAARGSQLETESHPLFLIAKKLKTAIETQKTEERRKLRPREKVNTKQPASRKK